MSLSALIRKRDTGNLATAIPAISATQPKGVAGTVARIATVAVANLKNEQTDPGEGGGNSSKNSNSSSSKPSEITQSADIGAGETAVSGWLLHFPDREPLPVFVTPPVTRAEVLMQHPGATEATPCTIFDVGPKKSKLEYALENAMGYCHACRHFKRDEPTPFEYHNGVTPEFGVCTIAAPGGIVGARRGYRPSSPGGLQRCPGFEVNHERI